MTFKEKAVAALRDAYESDCGPCRTVIRECMELVENLPDVKHENEKCAAPDYEAMYCETREELMEQKKMCENMACELRALHLTNSRLTGYRDAVERIFGDRV